MGLCANPGHPLRLAPDDALARRRAVMRDGGGPSISREFIVLPASRFNIAFARGSVGFPEVLSGRFGQTAKTVLFVSRAHECEALADLLSLPRRCQQRCHVSPS